MNFFLLSLFFTLGICVKAFRENYDYIIIGAGSAGSILATRLSEDPDVTVLLLEAGGEPPSFSESPGVFPLQLFSKYDWKYFTDRQQHTSFGEYWPRGKMLGGTGSMNLALFLRGNRRDFDYWVDNGCTNWSWDENLKYFKQIENYLVKDVDTSIHGTSGPINVTVVGTEDPTINLFVESAKKLGLKYRDPNDGDQSGVHHMPVNINHQKRQSSYTNYLRPIMKSRSNLHVQTFAFAERILFETANRDTATAVLVSKLGKQHKIQVRKEVIVSGGTINSPQLLMLSGIGPKEHLRKHKIEVIADLPVGKNLADDFVVWNLHKPDLSTIRDPSYLVMANAFFNSKYGNNSNYPDTQMVMFRDWVSAFSFVVSMRPESRGQILLKSTDPKVHPEIDFQYFSVERDLDVHSDGLRKASSILQEMGFKDTVVPRCKLHENDADEFWKCRVTSLGQSAWHPIGTCRMGDPSHKDTVVDCHLKVIGIKNLRVVDASVYPRPLNANPQATIYMLAEKASYLIKQSIK